MSADASDPFKALMEAMENPPVVDLSSLLKSNRRNNDRVPLNGEATIYTVDGRVISSGILRNVSPGGLGFEIKNASAFQSADVMVGFAGYGLDIGEVKCSVQWIEQIQGHANGNKMLGLQFGNLTAATKQKLDTYFDALKKLAEENA